MLFEDMSSQVKTAVVQILFCINRALLISSCNLVIALAIFYWKEDMMHME